MRAELDYCVPLGIPHSVFCGRVVDTGDPAWLDTDRGYALAWQANKKATCSGCGTRHDEWVEDRDAYVADVHYCRGDAVLAEGRKNLPKGRDGQPIPGFFAYLRPRTAEDDEPDDD